MVKKKELLDGIGCVDDMIRRCNIVLDLLEKKGKSPNNEKFFKRRFSVQQACEMVKRTRTSLYRAEEERIITVDKSPDTNRNLGYTIDQIYKLQEFFGTKPVRREGDPCLKVAVQSFKGGVAKSVTAVHLSQYLALKGYRVLIADFDPQASATNSFGFVADTVFTEEDTLLPYIKGDKEDIQYCILDTYFPGVKLIPSCLPFYDAEFHLAFSAARSDNDEDRVACFTEFVDAFRTVEKDFDVIIFDSPPALGMITINILAAADGLIVPTTPAFFDFSSTIQYFKMVQKVLNKIITGKKYNFIKILATRVDSRNPTHEDFIPIMRDVFGNSMMKSIFYNTNEIDNCSSDFKTVYDLDKPNIRAAKILNDIFAEIEVEILRWWPSRANKLVEEEILL
jgi:chromosome partitioning protein